LATLPNFNSIANRGSGRF